MTAGNDVTDVRGPGGRGKAGAMVSLITDKLGRQTLQDADRQPLLPEVVTSFQVITAPTDPRPIDRHRRTSALGIGHSPLGHVAPPLPPAATA